METCVDTDGDAGDDTKHFPYVSLESGYEGKDNASQVFERTDEPRLDSFENKRNV
jgi:hypothetical protein